MPGSASESWMPAASASEWTCVQDKVTGLIWEVKSDDGGLRDKNNTYSWYNPDSSSNGGDEGTADGGNCSDTGRCDTQRYLQAVNLTRLCDADDWRVPSRDELHSIVDYSRRIPAVDIDYFPHMQSGSYWSSSPAANDSDGAWDLHYGHGRSRILSKLDNGHLRLVRDGQ